LDQDQVLVEHRVTVWAQYWTSGCNWWNNATSWWETENLFWRRDSIPDCGST